MSSSMSSCDTFVVLPPLTKDDTIIFGKNSDRPTGEIQELIYEHPQSFPKEGSSLQCTYITIPQAQKTFGIFLSKPIWMWGAEMGANDQGVVIGNEAVYTKLEGDDDMEKKLLGMDLVRLGLERGSSAKEALDVITSLLEDFGQGGPCSNMQCFHDWTYHNSFLIADPKEGFVLETAGTLWAAEKITSGFRNISNCLSIGTNIDFCSKDLKAKAQELKLWNGQDEFHFANIFATSPSDQCERFVKGQELLKRLTAGGQFTPRLMFEILRDKPSGICMSEGNFVSASSQVSLLSDMKPCVHWMTGTPDPSSSVFKPFVFTSSVKASRHTAAQGAQDHHLNELQQNCFKGNPAGKEKLVDQLQIMEQECYQEIIQIVDEGNPDWEKEFEDLFDDCVKTEIRFYK